jgi:hypothetical protein
MKAAIPAKAGIHFRAVRVVDEWVPAFAGMAVTWFFSVISVSPWLKRS